MELTSEVGLAKTYLLNKVSPEEVCMNASGLKETKCPTVDGILNVVYKFAMACLYKLLAKVFSCLLIHCYVPNSLSVIYKVGTHIQSHEQYQRTLIS